MTDPGPVPLLFGFRGIRMLQLIVAVAAAAIAIGGVIMVKSYIDERSPWLLLLAVVFGLLFIWLCFRFTQERSHQNARRLFLFSITYLPLLWAVLVIDRIWL